MSYLGRSAKLSLKAQEKVSFLATAGQTVKTGLSYTVGFIEVYVNGVLLTDTTDFTATNGNSITFTVALLLNDEVTVISLKTFTVADHYNKTEADTLLAAKSPLASPTFTGNVSHGDNVKAKFGTGNDLEIFHDGSHSRIKDVGTGHLVLSGGEVHFNNSDNTSNHLVINSAGIVTKPLQPAFSVSRASAAQENIIINTGVIINYDNEHFDNNSDFNLSTSEFTAPVTGKYQLNAMVRLDNIDTASTHTRVDLFTSNGVYKSIIEPAFTSDPTYFTFNVVVLADMDAGDIAFVQVVQSGGTSQTDVPVSTQYQNFSGFLVC